VLGNSGGIVKKINISAALAVVILLVAASFTACSPSSFQDDVDSEYTEVELSGLEVTITQSPNCDCCEKYKAYLSEHGVEIETIYTEDLTYKPLLLKMPERLQSCHTMFVGQYFVEGHVPVAALKKLLAEKPAIDGITLPGMPLGSPGMPGEQEEPFIIYALLDGEQSDFMTINN
jgi:hypothetical protein